MRMSTQKTVYAAIMVALIVALSQIAIPLPSGIPVTLQTFAIAFVGFFIGWKFGVFTVGVYILLGICGVPVFASFTGGFYKVIGVTGGFIWGFLPMVALCGLSSSLSDGGIKKTVFSILFGLAGLFVCHIVGIGQFCLVTGVDFAKGIVTVSLPYLIKDGISVACAYFIAETVKKRLRIGDANNR